MIRLEQPYHGAVLDHRLGRVTPAGLAIPVSGNAPPDLPVTVNGQPARRQGERFTAEVVLSAPETELVARAGDHEQRVRVVYDRVTEPRYRFAVDDNIWCLREIARERPASLFDHFYLRLYRDLHQRFGARFTLNVFYSDGEGFDLSHFPSRYRAEWTDQADWLRLSFHAFSEFPDRPYESAPPLRLARDLDLVANEVYRFAGEAAYAPTTLLHWTACPYAALPVLAERGTRALSGVFILDQGRPSLHYGLTAEQVAQVRRDQVVKDFGTGITCSVISLICNGTPLVETVPRLEALAAQPGRRQFLDLLTHEQYFYRHYPNFIPDHAARLEATLRWVTEHGYRPVFMHEGYPGA
jgi:hypothetical protein